LLVISSALFLLLSLEKTFASTQISESLCDSGVTYYKQGKYEEALAEFNKVLLIDPGNQIAKKYVNEIFASASREDALDNVLKDLESQESGRQATIQSVNPLTTKAKPLDRYRDDKKYSDGWLKISGEAQLSFGINSNNDFIWKSSNYDLNERNWRMQSYDALNNGFNTYNRNIYQRLDLNLDTTNKDNGFNLHMNLVVDPWSFTGKSDKMNLTTAYGDKVEVQLLSTGATNYTLNQIAYSRVYGNSFALPEVKIVNGKVSAFNAYGNFYPSDTLSIPETKINTTFQPVRELWIDYQNDTTKVRIFPIAYQDQTLSSDDPLGITNHHKWWEDSLWLYSYQAGHRNTGTTPVDFTKGYYDNSLAFLSKDGNGTYLTALRGVSLSSQLTDTTSFSATVASPKTLWQDYGDVDNIIAAARLKQSLGERAEAGVTFTSRHGFTSDDSMDLDSENYVGGLDLSYEVIDGLKLQGEALTSFSRYDLTDSEYKSDSRGSAYYFNMVSRYPRESIKDVEYGYDGIKRGKDEDFLVKTKFYGAHMDRNFNSELSSFANTRDDMFWSRYITFRKPYTHFGGFSGSGANFDELWATRIGDGIDVGRNTIGFRTEYQYLDNFTNLLDVRNVHDVNGKFIENVARDEITLKVNDKLTVKGLGIYQHLPLTKGGVDPLLYDSDTGKYFLNSAVPDGKDPSLTTGSLGLEYAFLDWLIVNGVYEITNDYYLTYGNYPNGIYNSSSWKTYTENGRTYREKVSYLYDQGYFPQAPYPYYNIYKAGLRLIPLVDKFEIYIDYTRNEFELAGQNSENMNHLGCEFVITPTEKFGIVLKYVYSMLKDVDHLKEGVDKMLGHHNFFAEFYYALSKNSQLILEYGEGYINGSGIDYTLDPFGGSLTTLDTQHIIRVYYNFKF
jgi:hypothetical protein